MDFGHRLSENINILYHLRLVCHCFFGALLLVKCMDMVYILDKSCADIYVNGAETVKCVYAGSIRKNGNWIYVDRYIEDYYEEIRIKESEIVRIDYYGEPLIDVRKLSLRRN